MVLAVSHPAGMFCDQGLSYFTDVVDRGNNGDYGHPVRRDWEPYPIPVAARANWSKCRPLYSLWKRRAEQGKGLPLTGGFKTPLNSEVFEPK